MRQTALLLLIFLFASCADNSANDQLAIETVDPVQAGFSENFTAKLDQTLQSGISDNVAPAIVCLVGRHGKIVYRNTLGRMTYSDDALPAEMNSIFDMASVTKVVVTTTLSMIYYDRGLLDLDAKLGKYLPEAKNGDRVTIRQLMTHTAGFVAWEKFYLKYTNREKMLSDIFQKDLIYEPGTATTYSDLGIITLTAVLEEIGGMPLDELAKQEIFDPLSMKDSMYNPPSELIERIVPTEDDPWRGRVVHGEVHDENTVVLGGVSGHAGLFSTAEDLALFCQMYLNKGVYGGVRFFSEETLKLFTTRQDVDAESSRALGWDTPSGRNSAGSLLSKSSFGHTGFTGTMLWIDPENNMFIILLTNRVHPTRENSKMGPFRRLVNNTVAESIEH